MRPSSAFLSNSLQILPTDLSTLRLNVLFAPSSNNISQKFQWFTDFSPAETSFPFDYQSIDIALPISGHQTTSPLLFISFPDLFSTARIYEYLSKNSTQGGGIDPLSWHSFSEHSLAAITATPKTRQSFIDSTKSCHERYLSQISTYH